MDDLRDSVNWINESTISFDSLKNNHFSRIDSSQTFGIGFKGGFPTSSFGSNIYIEVKLKFRNQSGNAIGGLAFSVLRGDSTIIWDSKDLSADYQNWKINQRSFFLPANFVNSKNTLLIYCWSKNQKFQCDFDDLEITIGSLPLQKALIDLDSKTNVPFIGNLVTIKGTNFIVEIDSLSKKVRLLSSAGDTIISSIKILLETKDSPEISQVTTTLLITNADTISYINSNERVLVKIGFKSDLAVANVEMLIDNLSGKIGLETKVIFNRTITVERCAVVLGYGMPIRSIIKENSDLVSFNQGDFWLKNGQIVFAGKRYDLISDKSSKRSSTQIIGNHLVINLDFSMDHPMGHFPLMRKNYSLSTDASSKEYIKGTLLTGQINFITIDTIQPLLRLLKNPNGFLSSMVWTEHADFSDIRIQSAIMFGRQEIVNADSAIGGFVGHGIPITKSVFYDNPTKEKNSKRDKRFKSPSISIKRSPEFLEMLKQLKRKDFEICLHTPDPYTTNWELAEEAMKFMQENFSSVNWIDHGYDNSSKSNREDINCDGLDSTSKYYMSDLFKKYGVKYNWSSYYEDNGTFASTSFNSFFTNPYSGWDESYAAPEYFRNPKNESLISWRTTYTLDPPDGSLWSYYFDDVRLNDLVQSKGNCILHCYPARVDSTNGFYSFDGDKIVINPEFDKVLAKLKRYNDENKIWLTTVEKLLDYRLLLENVEIQYLENNRVVVYNNNEAVVKGVSVISASKSISAGEKNIRLKKDGEETIAIFDLAPKEKLILDLR